MARRLHVALLIESSRGYGRGLLGGIAEYVQFHGHWSIDFQRHDHYEASPSWLRKWHGDGIIARVENKRMARSIRAKGVPAVDLRGNLIDPEIPSILTDDELGTRLAFEHLLERGLRHFAFCGFVGTRYSDARTQVFQRLASKAGLRCSIYQPSRRVRGTDGAKREPQGWVNENDVAGWLQTLPRPVGLLACNDARGQQVLNACRQVGIAVPDEVAVIGVDNDEVVCDLCDPPLSSVDPNTRRIGYVAAALLEKLMAGAQAPARPIFIPPKGIVTRQSTDVLAIANRSIAAAVRFIRAHACEGITVAEVLAHVPLSCSSLERQFTKLLGHTPKAEILRVQLERVKQLLAATEFPLKYIAAKAGFSHTEYLSVVFKKKMGQTPGQYRALARQGTLAPDGF
jgi:LacI family transcriptional regulator